ncbi:MAG: response regulator [Lachnospiraceae bacterium]|nr:response regulator [Lachnospiraceae bacterium]
MYRCHVRVYLVGHLHRVFEIIKEMPPFKNFTHEFLQSDEPEEALAARADVILADLQGQNEKEALQILTSAKNREAELILLADGSQITRLLALPLEDIRDIWTMPMSDEEVRFRFLRWQEGCKMRKDFWQTSQFFEATINNVPNLIWYKDKNGIHEKVNDSFCKVVNKTKEQVEGQGHAYIWDVEQDDPACIKSEQEVMDKKETCVAEEIIQTGDGMRLLTTYKSPLYDLDGSVMGTVGVAIDVTQERAYEQQIVERNRILEVIFAATDCGVMCHTVDGSRILSINQAALKILGFDSQEELETAGFNMVAASVVEEDKDKVRECISKLKKEGDSTSIEYSVQHKDGKILHIMGNIKLIEEDGELFYQRFLFDCTAQKQKEQKERIKNEKRQMELVQALSIDFNLVYFYDIEKDTGIPLRLGDCENHVLASIFDGKRSLKEGMERYIETCVYEEDREMLRLAISQKGLKKELVEKGIYYINYRTMCGGEMKYYQLKAVRTGQWDGDYGIVLGFRSVDEEIRSEMEKKSQLEEALLRANEANRAKSVFLSNMSHDIRTPMNAIVGFTNLALTRIEQKEQVKEYLGKIKTSGNHLLSLINDVLDMSRIESGKMHLEEKPCTLPDILHGLCNILQADIRAKQLELYVDTVDLINEEIYCDKLRLNQVLLNLLSNAVKYTEEGGSVSLRVTEKSGAPEGSAGYEFYIKDTGIGMDDEFVSRIFEPFERERNSTISRIQGTGLGMAITKNIIDMMNGSIVVKSEKGVGTEVTVSFVFRLCPEKKEIQPITEFNECRALVVNSSHDVCNSVSHMLEQLGMQGEWALTAEEAVMLTREAVDKKEGYRVYIVDSKLSDMDGIEAVRRIREELKEEMPVIVLTAYDWSDIEDKARAAGVTTFCSKPLFLSQLRNCLFSTVNAHREKEKHVDMEKVIPHAGRILLAEDIELNQEIAVTILGEAGYETEVAGNGQIAVDMLRNSEPGYYQLILMDIQMPVMDGYAATKAIRDLENKELASIPIVAMSANAFEEDKQEALKCGMDGHIAKPIDIQNLFDTLDEILQ